MNKISTAEEFLEEWEGFSNDIHPDENLRNEWFKRKNQLIEFAKIHVKQALEIALKEAKLNTPTNDWQERWIEKDSILNSYPDENIR